MKAGHGCALGGLLPVWDGAGSGRSPAGCLRLVAILASLGHNKSAGRYGVRRGGGAPRSAGHIRHTSVAYTATSLTRLGTCGCTQHRSGPVLGLFEFHDSSLRGSLTHARLRCPPWGWHSRPSRRRRWLRPRRTRSRRFERATWPRMPGRRPPRRSRASQQPERPGAPAADRGPGGFPTFWTPCARPPRRPSYQTGRLCPTLGWCQATSLWARSTPRSSS